MAIDFSKTVKTPAAAPVPKEETEVIEQYDIVADREQKLMLL